MRSVLFVSIVFSLLGCGSAISYHGSGGGSASSAYKCPNSAVLKVTWRGESGTLTVAVVDAMLQEGVFSKTYYPGPVDQVDTQTLGVGNWNVSATRTETWKGAYSVEVDCK